MTRWKKAIAMAAALVLTLGLAAPALALGEIDLTKSGVITLQVMEGEGYPADLADAVTDVTVYQVATVNEYGAFALTEPFMSLQDGDTRDAWKGGILNSDEQVKALLAAALALVQPAEPEEGAEPAEPTEPPAEGATTPVVPAGKTYEGVKVVGGTITLEDDPDTDGKEDLGLFLVIPAPAKSKLWQYTFEEVLLAVPSIARAAEDPELDEDAWTYTVPVTLKAARERLLTDIVIEKSLPAYNATLGPTTFIFEVTATDPETGKVMYSNVVSLTFSGPGGQSVTVTDIPVGTDVTVTEVYSGGSYVPRDGKVSVEIEDLPLPEDGGEHARVGFTNDYTDERIPDGSVVNRYVYGGAGTGWDYQEEADR